MSNQLLCVHRSITWLRTIIRNGSYGIETEFHFHTADGFLSVAIDTLAHSKFLIAVIHVQRLTILDRSQAERGWTEQDRFEIRINDDDEPFESVFGTHVRWGPVP